MQCTISRARAFAALLECQIRVERRVLAEVADANHESAGIDSPFVGGFIPVAEGAGVEGEGDVLGLAGSEADLFKALRLALRGADSGGGIRDVDMGDFGADHLAGVGAVEAGRDRGTGGGDWCCPWKSERGR